MTHHPDDDQHPVDSATRPCCGGIGRHTARCSADESDELHVLAHMLNEVAGIVSRAASRIPADAPLWSVIDATAATAHVRAAARLLDRAATR
jgi:hypothetical protein